MFREVASTQLQGITDLTVIAPIRTGFVEVFESPSYAARLKRLLKTFNGLRISAREVLPWSPFPDAVSRIQTVQSIRFAVLDADPSQAGGTVPRLLLNVSFDRGWEPYMRVIWGDLGPLLDVIFCHCEGYVDAWSHSFDEYSRWVRAHEVASDFFYVDSALTVTDLKYLRKLERLQREFDGCAPPGDFDLAAARLSIDEPAAAALAAPGADALTADQRAAMIATAGLAPLAALHDLAGLFPARALDGTPLPDADHLLRASQQILRDLQEHTPGAFPAGSAPRELYGAQLAWFERALPRPQPQQARRTYDPCDVQGGILGKHEGVTHGCLVLLRITDRQAARRSLGELVDRVSREHPSQPAAEGQVLANVAFTFPGLRELGVPPVELARFPREFRDGMEARAGLLGDMRSNHPSQWALPRRNWASAGSEAPGTAVPLSAVHAVVQLRTRAPLHPDDHLIAGRPQHPLYAEVEALARRPGWQVLSVQAMQSSPAKKDHFGFTDGISQPVAVDEPQGAGQGDEVNRGELLLGYRNDRGDAPPDGDAGVLMNNGTFLVVRKLRQEVGAFRRFVASQSAALGIPEEDLKMKMMGRHTDGRTPVDPCAGPQWNAFTYADDPHGNRCPFQSHARRANPRNGTPDKPVPRLMRRGMSYGPLGHDGDDSAERGVVFMAYNASIAEQFEVIQRWVAGGNSSGVLSEHSDPFMGVPRRDDPRTFRFVHECAPGAGEKVLRVRLDGDAGGAGPFVKLQWGVYLFVPSLAALGRLAQQNFSSEKERPGTGTPGPSSRVPATMTRLLQQERDRPGDPATHDEWKALLEDRDTAAAVWEEVRRAHGGVLRTPYGTLVGDKALVMKVFAESAATAGRPRRYSVRGYGERMRETIGHGYLGMDDGEGYEQAHAGAVNAAIQGIDERAAFAAARAATAEALLALRRAGRAEPPAKQVAFDIKQLSDRVLAALCTRWFGLPDGERFLAGGVPAVRPQPPTCPGNFTSSSRYIFSPHPTATVRKIAVAHGQSVLDTVRSGLDQARKGELSQRIVAAIGPKDDDLLARTIAGVMLGFLPTVEGNLRTVLALWMKDNRLGLLQGDLLMSPACDPYQRALDALRMPLLRQMLQRPVPDMVWRTADIDHRIGANGQQVEKGERIIVGILSATQNDAAAGVPDIAPVFGGDRALAKPPLHACPGTGMALGVMLGVISGLFEAGSVKAAGATRISLVAQG